MSVITIGDKTIAYDDAGSSESVLVLIHGHPFDRSMWADQERVAREAGWRVVRPDLRGYGGSEVTPGRVTLEMFAADLDALLDALLVKRAVVGGLSMGGQIAMAFCKAYPRRVRGLLLAATFPRADDDATKVLRRETAERIEAEGMAAYADELIGKMIAPANLEDMPAVRDQVLEMMRSTPPQGAAAALRGRAERCDYTEAMRGFSWPALVVVGDQDAYTTRADAEAMRDALPDGQLLWLEGVGHMPNLEAPETFNWALLELLQRVREESNS